MLREASGKYFLWEEKFNSLNKLVDFYHTTTIAKKRQVFLRDEEPPLKVGGQGQGSGCLLSPPLGHPRVRMPGGARHGPASLPPVAQVLGGGSGPGRTVLFWWHSCETSKGGEEKREEEEQDENPMG